ncbi:MAG: MBL fold metallo-hydrolase [candidate division KSB1 bacterium]|nr:MBL fold metallo-hydrolase [candidate division KSB1 bacterium]MDZ7364999.1 MBL fold metallo-hydrolase [candidate division KSB1 bacterium]MDZ7403394.1 MBL fold metallo-hydrolase [candidate division KSB1 bacterium]
MTRCQEFLPGLLLTEVTLDDFSVRGAVIIGSQRLVVWDSLSHPRDMQPLQALLAGKNWMLVYSHADWDHVWGTAGLPYHNQTIIAHRNCRARFSEDLPLELEDKRRSQPKLWNEVILIPPTVTFEHQLWLDLGSVTLHLCHLPGHTLDCIVGFVPEWGVLLAGDAVETPLPVINADSPIVEWIAGLQRWEQDGRLQHVIPSHGIIGGRELLWQNIDYLQNLRNGIPPQLPEKLDKFYRETHQKNWQHNAITRRL